MDHEVQVLEVPPGERAGGLAHILLGVVAHTHREELHHLPGEVLVGRALHVHARIEVVEHRRIFGDRYRQVPEIAGRVALKHVDLQQHLPVVADLVLGRREVAVPEQRHLLFQRPAAIEHALGPPVPDPAGFQPRRAQPVEETVGHRLHVAIDKLGLDPDAHARATLHRQFGRRRAARREVHQRLIPESGMLERQQMVVRERVVVDELADRLLGRHVRQLLDVFRGAAETRAFQQVGGAVVAPVRGGDRRQIPRPQGRAGSPAGRIR